MITYSDAIQRAKAFDGKTCIPVLLRRGASLRLLPSATPCAGIVAADLLTAAQRASLGLTLRDYARYGTAGWAVYTTLPAVNYGAAQPRRPHAYSGMREPMSASQRRAGRTVSSTIIRGW